MKWFEIPKDLIPILRELQDQEQSYGILRSESEVTMYGGLGDAMYLTLDGRIVILDWMDDEAPPREAATLSEAALAITVGAKTRKCPELLTLLPARPPQAFDCAECHKIGWINLGTETLTFVCEKCGGLGWVTNDI